MGKWFRRQSYISEKQKFLSLFSIFMNLIHLPWNTHIELSIYLKKPVLMQRQPRDCIQSWYGLEVSLRKFILSYSSKY